MVHLRQLNIYIFLTYFHMVKSFLSNPKYHRVKQRTDFITVVDEKDDYDDPKRCVVFRKP